MCSTFLGNIKEAFVKNPNLTNLLFDDFFRSAIHNSQVCRSLKRIDEAGCSNIDSSVININVY